jgi:RNA polymerase sigma-70 factor (ECF subfamily)
MSASEIYSPGEDEAAFSEVYRTYHQKLLRYCEYRLRDRHEAEDVAQEAFVRAWRSMPTRALDRNFYPWLRVVAANLCTDVLRKRSRSEPVAVIDVGAYDGGMERISEDCDRALVRQALGRLNDRHRSALMMREGEGLTYDQIADRTGVTSGTVESLLWRARQALKREFTVLASSEGCFVVLPLVAAAVSGVREAARRAGRRVAAVGNGGDVNVLHVAFAAIATLGVVGGVAATLTPGRGANRPSVVVQSPESTIVSSTVPAHPPAPPAPSPAVAAGSPVTSGAPATTSPSTAVAATAPTTAAGDAPLRLRSAVSVGSSQAAAARRAPVGVNTGVLAIGASPTNAVGYLSNTLGRVGLVPPVPSTLPPGTKP